MKTLSLVLVSLLFASTSFADQCAYVTEPIAKTAMKLVRLSNNKSGGVLSFCQSCDEHEATLLRVNQIEIRNTGNVAAPKQLMINGKNRDLAYTYVNINSKIWVNLGMLSGCAPFGKQIMGESQFIIEKTDQAGRVHYVHSAKY